MELVLDRTDGVGFALGTEESIFPSLPVSAVFPSAPAPCAKQAFLYNLWVWEAQCS